MVIELASTPSASVIVRIKCRLTVLSSLCSRVNVGLRFFDCFSVSLGSLIVILFLLPYVPTSAHGSIGEYFLLSSGYFLSWLSAESGEPNRIGMWDAAGHTIHLQALSVGIKELQVMDQKCHWHADRPCAHMGIE